MIDAIVSFLHATVAHMWRCCKDLHDLWPLMESLLLRRLPFSCRCIACICRLFDAVSPSRHLVRCFGGTNHTCRADTQKNQPAHFTDWPLLNNSTGAATVLKMRCPAVRACATISWCPSRSCLLSMSSMWSTLCRPNRLPHPKVPHREAARSVGRSW